MSTFFMRPGEARYADEQQPRKTAGSMAEPIHIGHIIHEELRAQGRTVTWLARQLGTSRMACYRIFHSYSIDTHLLYRISELLERNLFEVYSGRLTFNKEYIT